MKGKKFLTWLLATLCVGSLALGVACEDGDKTDSSSDSSVSSSNVSGDSSVSNGSVNDESSSVSENDESSIVDGETQTPSKGYAKFQAEWYKNEFIGHFGSSYASDYYESLSDDDWIMGSIKAWEGLHLVAEPSYETGKMKAEDLYMLAIYDILTGESGQTSNPLDLFGSDCDKYFYECVKIIFGDENIEMDKLKDIDPALHKQTVLNSELFDGIDAISKIFDVYNNLSDALNACARYQAIANMDVGFKNVLTMIAEDTANDKDLRNAAKRCVECFENACKTTMESILLKEFVHETAKDFRNEFVNKAWEKIATAIFPQAMAVQFAVKGVVVLGDSLFKLDATNQAFYKLRAAVGLEDATRRILESGTFDFSKSADCETYMYAVEMFQRSVLLGGECSKEILQTRLDSVLMTPSQREEGEQQKANIENFNKEKLQTYANFEEICQKMHKANLNDNTPDDSSSETVSRPDDDSSSGGTSVRDDDSASQKESSSISENDFSSEVVSIPDEDSSSSETSATDDSSTSEETIEKTPSEGLEYTLSDDGTYYTVADIGSCTDTEIVIPAIYNNLPVTSIGDYAFHYCDNLTNVIIGCGVTSIEGNAFNGCSSLTSIEIPDSVTSIGYRAFNSCSSLTSLVIGDGVTSIGEWAFHYCHNLTNVIIGGSVTSIGKRVFSDCGSLTFITFNGTVEEWNAIEKGNDWNVNIPATEVVCKDGKVELDGIMEFI